MRAISLDQVRRALSGRGPGRPPAVTIGQAHPSAVLIVLFEHDAAVHVVLTRRSSTLRHHRGDVAFPGGRQDPGEELVDAALREAHEEIGLDPRLVELVGELDHLSTAVSGFVIAPFVGVVADPPTFRPNPAEIERVFAVPLTELLDAEVYHEELWDLPWGERAMSFFDLEGDTVWGATARILRQLLVLVTGVDAP